MSELPKTLKGLIEDSGFDHSGWRLCWGHYVELKHSLMGTFPAIERESGEMVMTTDLELMRKVFEKLNPRRHKFGKQLIYVNEEGQAFSVTGVSEFDLERTEPYQILSEARFSALCAASDDPFMWSPGLVGNDMSAQEFGESIRAAIENGPP